MFSTLRRLGQRVPSPRARNLLVTHLTQGMEEHRSEGLGETRSYATQYHLVTEASYMSRAIPRLQNSGSISHPIFNLSCTFNPLMHHVCRCLPWIKGQYHLRQLVIFPPSPGFLSANQPGTVIDRTRVSREKQPRDAVFFAVCGRQVVFCVYHPLNHSGGIPQCTVQKGKAKMQGPVSNAVIQGICSNEVKEQCEELCSREGF